MRLRVIPNGSAPVPDLWTCWTGAEPFRLSYLSTLPTSKTEKERNALIDEVASIEKVEAELNGFIERRAKGSEQANTAAALERLQEERRQRRYREAVLRQRLDFHRQQLESHTRTFSRLLERHKGALRLVEAELGITTNEGENAA